MPRPVLFVHRSNRTERLVDRLASLMNEVPLADPMMAEVVTVHSRSTQRWLSQQLSRRLGAPRGSTAGVCANVEYPFPGGLARRVLDRLSADADLRAEQQDPWEPERLTWALIEVLPSLLEDEGFGLLRRYLADGDRAPEVVDRRLFQLAYSLAHMYDGYTVYRPRMILDWSLGRAVSGPRPGVELEPAQRWQPRLWAAVREHLGESGELPSSLVERYLGARSRLRAAGGLGERELQALELPPRVHLFGLAALPPIYLEVLCQLSRSVDVHLYVMCPSRLYWADIRSRREQLRALRREIEGGGLLDASQIEQFALVEGNPLLASFGRVGRDFQLQLESFDGIEVVGDQDDDLFEHPVQTGSALELLQADVLDLVHRGTPGQAADGQSHPAGVELDPADDSIAIHACHGAMRQVEVLREELLRRLDGDPSLEPRDILVMTPDVGRFAPLVTAVFSGGQSHRGSDPEHPWGVRGGPALPFQIADRSLRELNPIAELVDAVLELVPGRLGAPEVLDLLSRDPVRERFGIDAADLPRIDEWVRQAGIRWGQDASHRAEHGQPEHDGHTWRAGLDRLLLGVAMADEDERSFGDAIPYDDMEGDAVELLGRFADFAEALFVCLKDLRAPRGIKDWSAAIARMLEALVTLPTAQGWLVQQVRDVLNGLQETVGETAVLERDVLRNLIDGRLELGSGVAGHHTGAVTFSGMVPLRSVPHRVVVLLGMDDGAFPRLGRSHGFDLLGDRREVGDRNPREEDRYLMLEALLSARDAFLVLYTGRDVRTNEPRPPAVPVGELADVLDASFRVPRRASAEARVGTTTRASEYLTQLHPLQPFSPRNFGIEPDESLAMAPEPFSHDLGLAAGARRLLDGVEAAPAFVQGPLAEASESGEEVESEDELAVDLDGLVRFFRHPVKHLLERRLRLFLDDEHETLEGREPFELGGLDRWKLGATQLDRLLDGADVEAARAAFLRRGAAAPGSLGERQWRQLFAEVDALVQRAGDDLRLARETRAIDVVIPGAEVRPRMRIVGTVDGLNPLGVRRVVARFGKPSNRYRLEHWIRQLALTASTDEDGAWTTSFWASTHKKPVVIQGVASVGQARELLADLVALYLEGHREPLPFFPDASYSIAKSWLALEQESPGDPAALGAQAVAQLRDSWPALLEGDEHLSRTYGHLDSFETLEERSDGALSRAAIKVWAPFLVLNGSKRGGKKR